MDIEKAFDSIWHKGLIYKLNKFNFPIYLIKIINSFLSDRSFKVILNDTLSIEKEIPAGVPQGAILSPTLYSIYIADFKPQADCDIAFYADDSAIIASGKSSNKIVNTLQKGLKSSIKYYTKWKIKVNVEKTQAILFPFNKSPKRSPTKRLTNGTNIIPFSNSAKYLGVTLDKKLLFKEHIDKPTNV